jgi:hypothetical protein
MAPGLQLLDDLNLLVLVRQPVELQEDLEEIITQLVPLRHL